MVLPQHIFSHTQLSHVQQHKSPHAPPFLFTFLHSFFLFPFFLKSQGPKPRKGLTAYPPYFHSLFHVLKPTCITYSTNWLPFFPPFFLAQNTPHANWFAHYRTHVQILLDFTNLPRRSSDSCKASVHIQTVLLLYIYPSVTSSTPSRSSHFFVNTLC